MNGLIDEAERVSWFDIHTVEEGIAAVEDMQKRFILLRKEIKKVELALRESLTQRAWGQVRNSIISVFDAFEVDSLEAYREAIAIFGEDMATSLYQVQLNFKGLRASVLQAMAPLAQVLLPVIQTAVYLLSGLAQALARVLSFLFLGTAEVQEYDNSVNNLVTSVKTLKKSLAGFDQINRLNQNDGVSGVVSGLGQLKPMSGSWAALADKLDKLLQPLKNLDLGPAAESLERLRKALQPITKALFEGLEWAWYNLLVPLAQWAVEELLPVFLDMLTTALEALGRIIEELKPYLSWLWEEWLKPLAQWKGNQIIEYIKGIATELGSVSGWITLNRTPVEQFISSSKLLIQAMGEMADNTMQFSEASEGASGSVSGLLYFISQLASPFENSTGVFHAVTSAVWDLASAFGLVTDSSNGAWYAMKQLWEHGWNNLRQNLMNPAYSGLRETLNSIIGLMNSMLYSTTTSVNHLGSAMNGLSFTIPNWVPLIGGKTFSFGIRMLRAPQIPYLAKGAVLPANKPFMAVVGDQKHGTNVEAPLTVIQEAVAAVMEDYISANMAGHQATVGVLREILEAVLGITIGDDVIAAAAARYDRKMAVVRGGYV